MYMCVLQEEKNENSFSLLQDGARRNTQLRRQDDFRPDAAVVPRILLISNKVKNSLFVQSAALPHVKCIQYKYEASTLESLIGLSKSLDLCGPIYTYIKGHALLKLVLPHV